MMKMKLFTCIWNALEAMDSLPWIHAVQGVPGEAMAFSNTHPIWSSDVHIDSTLALPCFFLFVFFLPTGVCFSAVIWNDFWLLSCANLGAGRTEQQQRRGSNIYSQSERIVQGVGQKHKYGSDPLVMRKLAGARAAIQLKWPNSLQFHLFNTV